MNINEANQIIADVADTYHIPVVQWGEDDFITGKETTVATFTCYPKTSYDDNRITATLEFVCRIREMATYTVEEMHEIAQQCKNVALCVDELNHFFSGKKITM